MRQERVRCGFLAILSVVGLMAFTARGDEQVVELKDLPVVVRQAADKAVSDAKWTEASSEENDDEKTTYRLKGVNAKGCKVQVRLSAEGKVEAVEILLGLDELKELPVAVRKAADKASPGAKWAEATIQVEEDESTYRLKGTDTKGLQVEMTLNAGVRVEAVETVLSVNDLPKPLADVLKPLTEVKWREATATASDGETRYHAHGTDSKDHELRVSLSIDGRLTVRTVLHLDEVPAIVSDALKAKRPLFLAASVESVARQGVVTYVFEGDEQDDEEMKISVSSDGKMVAVAKDEDED